MATQSPTIDKLPGGFRRVKLVRHPTGECLRVWRGHRITEGLKILIISAFFTAIPGYGLMQGQWGFAPFLLIGVIIMLYGLGTMAVYLISCEELLISSDTLTHRISYPWGPMFVTPMACQKVVSIEVMPHITLAPTHCGLAFKIKGREEELFFYGQMLEDEAQQLASWLRRRYELDRVEKPEDSL